MLSLLDRFARSVRRLDRSLMRARSCRQIPRRGSFFCRAEETEDAYVDDVTEREMEYQAYQTARAAAYQFPEEYKRSVMAPTRPTPVFGPEEVGVVFFVGFVAI